MAAMTSGCEFTVTHPTFTGGGLTTSTPLTAATGTSSDSEDLGFELTASISASPAGGSPGEIILIQLVDFPVGPVVMVTTVAHRGLWPIQYYPGL